MENAVIADGGSRIDGDIGLELAIRAEPNASADVRSSAYSAALANLSFVLDHCIRTNFRAGVDPRARTRHGGGMNKSCRWQNGFN